MSNAPLMPMATAVWLVENTTLTFKQIADFCQMHEVEIQGIADGEVAKGIKAYNPIISGLEAITLIFSLTVRSMSLIIPPASFINTIPAAISQIFKLC